MISQQMGDCESGRNDVSAQGQVWVSRPNVGQRVPTAAHDVLGETMKVILARGCTGSNLCVKLILSVFKRDCGGGLGDRAINGFSGEVVAVAGVGTRCCLVVCRLVCVGGDSRCHRHFGDRLPCVRRERGLAALWDGRTKRQRTL